MPTFDVNAPVPTSESEWTPLPTDTYEMVITEAQIAPSKFPDDRGDYPEMLALTWKLAEWNDSLAEIGCERGQKVYQSIKYFDGNTKSGQPSKYRQFILDLVADGTIPARYYIAGENEASNQGDLIGVRRRVMVEKYVKKQGVNAGKFGNKVIATTPLKHANTGANGHTPQPAAPPRPVQPAPVPAVEEELPLAGTTAEPPPLDYLRGLYQQVNSLSLDELREVAPQFAQVTGREQWQTKNFPARNEVLLRHDITAMWSMIERDQAAARDPNGVLF